MHMMDEYHAKRDRMTDFEKKEADKYRLGDFIPFHIGYLVRIKRGANIDDIPFVSAPKDRQYGLYQRATTVIPLTVGLVELLKYLGY